MLILSRRVGETIMIGDQVTVTVLHVKGQQIRLGIAAPKHVGVHRKESYARLNIQQPVATGKDRPPEPTAAQLA